MGALALSSPKVSPAKPVERDLRAFRWLPSKTAIQTANQTDRREAFQPIFKRNLRVGVAPERTRGAHTLKLGFAQAQDDYYIFANYFKANLPETDLFRYSIRGMDMRYSQKARAFFL